MMQIFWHKRLKELIEEEDANREFKKILSGVSRFFQNINVCIYIIKIAFLNCPGVLFSGRHIL